MKRSLDLLLAGLGLILVSPLMAMIALLVRWESPGGALFRQVRVGLHGRHFEILKFRSMRTDHDGLTITSADDPRITRTGRLLRSTKLDELPQLVNVLRGDMSLIGPRPEVPRYVAHWPEEAKRIVLSIRPGITDPASIDFRRESELLAKADDPERYYIDVLVPAKLEIYMDYVRSRSAWGDVKILCRTLRTTVAH